MKIGSLSVTEVNLGFFKLDGGAMFGVVPKVLWEKKIASDSANRIDLALRCLLIEGPGYKCLIDSGMGQKWNPKEEQIFALSQNSAPDQWLKTHSVIGPEQITHVFLTHLHFDHAGGMTYLNADGLLEKSFPNAQVFLNSANLQTAEKPNPRERVSYRSENWELYKKSGQLQLLNSKVLSPELILPDLSLIRSDGHTQGQQLVLIGNKNDGHILFCADLIPTSQHLPLAWTMGYDVNPLLLMQERQIILDWACEQNWMLCFEHDPVVSLGRAARVERRSGGFDFELSEDLSEKFRTAP